MNSNSFTSNLNSVHPKMNNLPSLDEFVNKINENVSNNHLFCENKLNMKTSFLKPSLTERFREVDLQTGEVKGHIKKLTYLANSNEEFYLLFSSVLGIFTQMNQAEIRVYAYFLMQHKVGSEIAVPRGIRLLIAEATDLKSGSVANALGKLVEKKLLYTVSKGIYKINPRYAFKGSTSERKKLLKFILEAECPDC